MATCTYTPWGAAHNVISHIRGVKTVSTSTHGGIMVSHPKNLEVEKTGLLQMVPKAGISRLFACQKQAFHNEKWELYVLRGQ